MSSTQTIEFICHPFGMVMPGRNWTATGIGEYRLGFNGKENDDEVKGDNNSVDFGARIYDPRISRWIAVDKGAVEYPYASPFIFALNCPTYFLDPDGNVVVGNNGEPVEFDVVQGENGKFTLNVTSGNIDLNSDAYKILSALTLQSQGRAALEAMKSSEIEFKVKKFHISDEPGQSHGDTYYSKTINGFPKKPRITIYVNEDQFSGDRMEI